MLPQLTTERFLLQPILPEDKRFVFQGLSHPQVIPHYGVQYRTLEETSAQMQYYSQVQKQGTGGWWKIVNPHRFEKLGAVGFTSYSAQHQKCEIGYWLLPRHWGGGVMTEAVLAVIRFLITEKDIHRVEALIEPENKRSCRVAEAAGFKLEGLLRDYEKKEGRFLSLRVYSLLAAEFVG